MTCQDARAVFRDVVNRAARADGKMALRVDLTKLRQELSGQHREGPQERLSPELGRARPQALITANAPIAKPCALVREESGGFRYHAEHCFQIEGDTLRRSTLLRDLSGARVKMNLQTAL